LKIDITTGDSIVPKEIEFKYKMLFEDQTIEILSYTLETVLAEKIETIIRRNISNTRARDFYDVYILYQLKQTEIKWVVLHEALIKTAKKRNSEEDLEDYKEIIKELEESSYIQNIWNNYAAENTYAQNIAFTDILSVLKQIIDRVI
jgi:predicted nucleotidyltransferase component of viral defense system